MDTPICDFVRQYVEENSLRLHMPGHKGKTVLGVEHLDITEINGADDLYDAEGIIRKSERNASTLFGCPTCFSTEGSSQCIRAMMHLTMLHAKKTGRKPLIAAGRNAHKTFLSAAALLDFQILWLYPESEDSYLSCDISAAQLEKTFAAMSELPTAVYITSPDYLGKTSNIQKIAEVCHRYHILVLVDNAHGAYLKFLENSQFPMDLGADMCCSSAHKTLPVLTGGAYMHLSEDLAAEFTGQIKNAMGLFGSTSPSYLIMQSLDAANLYLSAYPKKLQAFCSQIEMLKNRLIAHGFTLCNSEPLKITISPKSWGYTGLEFAKILQEHHIICEFADPDYIVLMLTPEIEAHELNYLERILVQIERKTEIVQQAPTFHKAEMICSFREATLSLSEVLPVEACNGRILASASVGCPPAVPILVCGERIDHHAIECFRYYGIEHCTVMKEN